MHVQNSVAASVLEQAWRQAQGWGVKQILLIIAVVALVGCGESKEEKAAKAKAAAAETKAAAEAEESAKIIETAIRKAAKKLTGELTKADYEKVRRLFLRFNQLTEAPKGLEKLPQLKQLHLEHNQLTDVTGLENLKQLESLNLVGNKLTDVKDLENLTQLTELWLKDNPDLTKAQIAELKKALPECKILSNLTK